MTDAPAAERFPLHHQILVGFVVGILLGIFANELVARELWSGARLEWIVENVTGPIGQIFLNLLFFVVVPIVFSSIVLGIAQLENAQVFGRLAGKTFAYFVATSLFSALIGLALVSALRPGVGFDASAQQALTEAFGSQAAATTERAVNERFWPDVLVGIVSRNPLGDAVEPRMLPVIFSAVLIGLALGMVPRERSRALLEVLDGIGQAMVVIVGLAMRLAPIAVFALIFGVVALFGWEILRQVSMFVVTVSLGYLVHLFLGYALLLRWVARVSPFEFFRRVLPVMITALTTSSSSATLPTTMKVAEDDLRIPSQISGFVLPLGATTNMNGTSLFVTIVVVFLAQVFGVNLGVGNLVLVLVFAVMTAVGAAGVPSGSLPIIVAVLQSFGIPGEGIAIIIGVDRVLDMGRTVVNVTGDATAACYVASSEGHDVLKVTRTS